VYLSVADKDISCGDVLINALHSCLLKHSNKINTFTVHEMF